MYKIEIRDINGKRSVYEFDDNNSFYEWAINLRDNNEAYDLEILWISLDGMVLYSELYDHGMEMLDWDALIGFLS